MLPPISPDLTGASSIAQQDPYLTGVIPGLENQGLNPFTTRYERSLSPKLDKNPDPKYSRLQIYPEIPIKD